MTKSHRIGKEDAKKPHVMDKVPLSESAQNPLTTKSNQRLRGSHRNVQSVVPRNTQHEIAICLGSEREKQYRSLTGIFMKGKYLNTTMSRHESAEHRYSLLSGNLNEMQQSACCFYLQSES